MGFWKPRAFSLCARVYWEWIWHLSGRRDHASPPVSFLCVFHSWYFWLMARTLGVFFFLAGLTELTLTKPTLNSYPSLSHLKKSDGWYQSLYSPKRGSLGVGGVEKSLPLRWERRDFCPHILLLLCARCGSREKYPGLTQLGGTWLLSLSFLHLPSKSDG